MSDPMPSGLPFRATRVPSPPDEPPEVRFLLYGLTVRPKMLLNVSGHCSWVRILFNVVRVKLPYHKSLGHVSLNERYGAALVEDIH